MSAILEGYRKAVRRRLELGDGLYSSALADARMEVYKQLMRRHSVGAVVRWGGVLARVLDNVLYSEVARLARAGVVRACDGSLLTENVITAETVRQIRVLIGGCAGCMQSLACPVWLRYAEVLRLWDVAGAGADLTNTEISV